MTEGVFQKCIHKFLISSITAYLRITGDSTHDILYFSNTLSKRDLSVWFFGTLGWEFDTYTSTSRQSFSNQTCWIQLRMKPFWKGETFHRRSAEVPSILNWIISQLDWSENTINVPMGNSNIGDWFAFLALKLGESLWSFIFKAYVWLKRGNHPETGLRLAK